MEKLLVKLNAFHNWRKTAHLKRLQICFYCFLKGKLTTNQQSFLMFVKNPSAFPGRFLPPKEKHVVSDFDWDKDVSWRLPVVDQNRIQFDQCNGVILTIGADSKKVIIRSFIHPKSDMPSKNLWMEDLHWSLTASLPLKNGGTGRRSGFLLGPDTVTSLFRGFYSLFSTPGCPFIVKNRVL